ncbi:MAG: hypothetical protein IT452_08175 [Planctomycetia bacterium]|nr:hypothetical protein [Planctomycetia bacterium]
MKTLALLAVVAVAAPLVAGCRHHRHVVSHGVVVHPGGVVHYHGTGCGHVYRDGCWVEPRVVIVPPRPHFRPPFPHRLFHHHR